MQFNNLVVLLSLFLILFAQVLVDAGCSNPMQSTVLGKFTSSSNAGSFRAGSDIISKGVTQTEFTNATVVEESTKKSWKEEKSISNVNTPTVLSKMEDGEESTKEGCEESHKEGFIGNENDNNHLVDSIEFYPRDEWDQRSNIWPCVFIITPNEKLKEGDLLNLEVRKPNGDMIFSMKPKRYIKKPNKLFSIEMKLNRSERSFLGVASSKLTIQRPTNNNETETKDTIEFCGPKVMINFGLDKNGNAGKLDCDNKSYSLEVRTYHNYEIHMSKENDIIFSCSNEDETKNLSWTNVDCSWKIEPYGIKTGD